MSCCWRRSVNTERTTATGSLRCRLRDARSLVPSTESRRRNRSVTRPEGIPRLSRSLGAGGQKSHCSSPNRGIRSLASIGRIPAKVYARPAMPPRHRFVRVLALVVSLGVVFAVARPVAAADDPQKLYEEGRKAERAGHMARAYLLYSQAAELEPQNQLYWLRSQAVQSRAALESPPKAPEVSAKASDAVARASADSIFDALTPKDRVAERQPQPPVELQGTPGRQDFDLRADAKSLWEQVAGALGLDTVFDGDYQPGPQIRFHLTASDYRETLHALEAATGSFIVPISKRLFLV